MLTKMTVFCALRVNTALMRVLWHAKNALRGLGHRVPGKKTLQLAQVMNIISCFFLVSERVSVLKNREITNRQLRDAHKAFSFFLMRSWMVLCIMQFLNQRWFT